MMVSFSHSELRSDFAGFIHSGKPGDLMPDINVPSYSTYVNGNPGDLMPKQELIDRLKKDYTVIVVTYVKDWNNYRAN